MTNKNLLVGNGLNINFSDEEYKNWKIIERLHTNLLEAGRYESVFANIVRQEELLAIVDEVNRILQNMLEQGVFSFRKTSTKEEMQALMNICKRYSKKVTNNFNIGFEDYFFMMKWFINNEFENHEELTQCVFDGLKILFLDSIYNNGKIENLFNGMKLYSNELDQYDQIFTVNYDNNLDKLTDKCINHLHGSFDELDDTYRPDTIIGLHALSQKHPPTVIPGMEHLYCNAIMGYSGDYKMNIMTQYQTINKLCNKNYKVHEYPIEEFCSIQGELQILGMSPNNDSHIFSMINNNSRISNIVYFSANDDDSLMIQQLITKNIKIRNVFNYWNEILN